MFHRGHGEGHSQKVVLAAFLVVDAKVTPVQCLRNWRIDTRVQSTSRVGAGPENIA